MHARVLGVVCVLLGMAIALATARTTTISEASATTSPPPKTRTIPIGYTYYLTLGSAYKFYGDLVTWEDANTTCAREGAHVVVMNDAREADVVARMVQDADHYSTWIGLRNNRPGGVTDWRTVNGEPVSDVFHVWRDGRPYNNAQYTCAAFGAYNKLLYDEPCTDTYYFICEV